MGFGTNLCQSPSILYSVVNVGCMLQSPMEFREIVVTLRWLPLQSYPTRPCVILMRILLFRCCITYLDRSRNIIRFFDMPWILTTAAFYYGCLQSSYICGHKDFRHLCCSMNSAMLPHWLLYMVFRKQRSITYFAREPSRMMITCSQGSCHTLCSTNNDP
ncbi:uncharacterized protein LOC143304062 isoform X2 [Bombus vancouverensis nearcticus]|uniref:uncharacterized protein LOC143304009 n=1 Tax=Bombus vancouverensis nearcticus TaxID=2705178 RepID=UPI00402BDBC3